METPVRLLLSRRGGFNLQATSREKNGLPAIRVSRPGPWGNRQTAMDMILGGLTSPHFRR